MRVVVDYGIRSGWQAPSRSGAAGDPVMVIRRGAAESPDAAGSPGTADEEATTPEAITRDRVVRRHEQAHQAALGGHAASGIQLQTARGADGEALAVGGRIKVDLSEVPGNPRATLQKANTVRMAALAVSDPSAADLRVAAEAYRLARDAREQIAGERSGGEARAKPVNLLA